MAAALRRIGVYFVTVVLASIVVFTVIAVLPGDPAEIYAGTQATPNQVANLREEYGLNAPIPVRYGRWVSDLVATWARLSSASARSPARSVAGSP
jgi:ABC-type dipeptide/oligopeptide/nickel transport system permease component